MFSKATIEFRFANKLGALNGIGLILNIDNIAEVMILLRCTYRRDVLLTLCVKGCCMDNCHFGIYTVLQIDQQHRSRCGYEVFHE